MPWVQRNHWIVLAVASGACAAFNGVFAKLYVVPKRRLAPRRLVLGWAGWLADYRIVQRAIQPLALHRVSLDSSISILSRALSNTLSAP
jgi:hypothetical protein